MNAWRSSPCDSVRNTYRNSDDFAKVESFLETLYVSGRLNFL